MVVYNRSNNSNSTLNNKKCSHCHSNATSTTTTTMTTSKGKRWGNNRLMTGILQFSRLVMMLMFGMCVLVLSFRWRTGTLMTFSLGLKNHHVLLPPSSIVMPIPTTNTTTRMDTNLTNNHNKHISNEIVASSIRTERKNHVQPSSLASPQLPPPRYPLEFVHIPKTGGTAIETAAAKGDGMAWGACHYCMKSKGTPCPPQHRFFLYRGEYLTSLLQSQSASNKQDTMSTIIYPWPAFWHIPPSYMRQYKMLHQALPNFFINHSNNQTILPYPENIPLFAVVRNPYHRMLSEWYYDAQETRKMGEAYCHNATEMNQYLFHHLQQFQQTITTTSHDKRHKYTQRPRPEHFTTDMTLQHPYWIKEGHYIPQYDYIYDTISTINNHDAHHHNTTDNNDNKEQESSAKSQSQHDHRQIVQHVLKFENLTLEYSELMKQYGLQNRLPTQRINTIPYKPILTIHHFSNHVLQLLNEIYHNDFIMFGYEKIRS